MPRTASASAAARAGNTAALASYLALAALGRRRVLPALLVRRHVRRTVEQFTTRKRSRRGQLGAVVGLAAVIAFAVASSRHQRTEQARLVDEDA